MRDFRGKRKLTNFCRRFVLIVFLVIEKKNEEEKKAIDRSKRQQQRPARNNAITFTDQSNVHLFLSIVATSFLVIISILFFKSSSMAQTTQISTFEKLLNTRYPLTNYLYRQQQFLKVHSNTSNPLNTTPSLSSNSTEVLSTIAVQTRKTPLPAPTCFNVPDTLDFNASGCRFTKKFSKQTDDQNLPSLDEQDEEMDQNSEINDDIAALGFDETLLKSIDNHINNKTKVRHHFSY